MKFDQWTAVQTDYFEMKLIRFHTIEAATQMTTFERNTLFINFKTLIKKSWKVWATLSNNYWTAQNELSLFRRTRWFFVVIIFSISLLQIKSGNQIFFVTICNWWISSIRSFISINNISILNSFRARSQSFRGINFKVK